MYKSGGPEPILNVDDEDGLLGSIEENGRRQELFVIRNTEEELWNKLKKGDQSALGELYKLHIDSLFSYGVKITDDRDWVMDCIHDLFVDLYKYRKGLSSTNNVKYYLFSSLKRKIVKKHNRKTIPASRINASSHFENKKHSTESHEEELISAERISEKNKKLDRALDSLTRKQRKGLFLKFKEQRNYKEIAEQMDISIDSARTMIYRALKSLR
ncbi:RNA polymerase sigma factor [Allomuricauda sp. F6463D]|uniref:RNA polymerase sigma factor n=1 Tax=Allomuricauda sp. F6463D TaxID=2926409 RepID=UPI001FF111BF|nr:sigma-70 family RNA polymerase sigma factor [Muricauda sp. F6463D]MCK0160559.1 sigma-70 family RNA polymerase sigma factor [Muricauda sp. F6463D]